MLRNTDYNSKYYVFSCPQYSNHICRILRNKVKNISSNIIIMRIYFLMYTFELFHVIIKTRYMYTYISTIYIDMCINTFQNTILSICANLYQKRGTIFWSIMATKPKLHFPIHSNPSNTSDTCFLEKHSHQLWPLLFRSI